MKKIIAAIIILAILTAGSAGAFFFIFKKNKKIAENSPAQTVTNSQLKSFRGTLADVLKDATQETQAIEKKIAEAIPSPFAENKNENEPSDELTFAIIGDTQYFSADNPRGNFQKAAAQIKEHNPDLVIAVGDLISNCKGKNQDAQDYANWKNVLGPLMNKAYAVQGNHDRVENVDKCDQLWQNAFDFPTNGPSGFSETAYSLDFKNSHFVFLNSDKPDGHQINKVQRDWLEQDLAKNQKENTFVIFHEPAYPVSDKITESLDANPSERNALWQILEKYNVAAVFNGHEHIVSRRKIGSLYQFVFGSTDSFNHNPPAPGVAEYANQGQGRFGIVKVNGKEITVETYDSNGKILNTFTFSK